MTASTDDFKHLLPECWKETVVAWLKEDCPGLDYGGYVVGDWVKTATLWLKSPGVIAGRPFVDQVFGYLGCRVYWHEQEGAYIPLDNGSRVKIATVRGPARQILFGERVALNILARCSGSISAAIQAARKVSGFSLKIDVEVRSEEEANEAIEAGADIVMLDNFSGAELKATCLKLKSFWQGKRHFLLECSGGLTHSNIAEYLCNGPISQQASMLIV